MIADAKLYLGLGALLFMFTAGLWTEHIRWTASDARRDAQQSQATATAVLAERASTAAETARLTDIEAKYEALPVDPIATALTRSVYVYEAAHCPVPGVPANPAKPSGAPAIAPSDDRLADLSRRAIEACAQDSAELSALQAAWKAQN